MRPALLLLLGLAACAGTPPGVRPVPAGGSRADGIVTMASTSTIYNPVTPDWRAAEAEGRAPVPRLGPARAAALQRLAGGLPGLRHLRPLHRHHHHPLLQLRREADGLADHDPELGIAHDRHAAGRARAAAAPPAEPDADAGVRAGADRDPDRRPAAEAALPGRLRRCHGAARGRPRAGR